MVSIYRRMRCAKCGRRPIVERKRFTRAFGGTRNYYRVKCSCGNTAPWVYGIGNVTYHRDPKASAISAWNKLNTPGTPWHIVGSLIRMTKENQHAD